MSDSIPPPGPKSKVFDEQIREHLNAIHDVCLANNINFAAYFALDEVMKNCILQCRMARVYDEEDLAGAQAVLKIWQAIKDGEDEFEDKLPSKKGDN